MFYYQCSLRHTSARSRRPEKLQHPISHVREHPTSGGPPRCTSTASPGVAVLSKADGEDPARPGVVIRAKAVQALDDGEGRVAVDHPRCGKLELVLERDGFEDYAVKLLAHLGRANEGSERRDLGARPTSAHVRMFWASSSCRIRMSSSSGRVDSRGVIVVEIAIALKIPNVRWRSL